MIHQSTRTISELTFPEILPQTQLHQLDNVDYNEVIYVLMISLCSPSLCLRSSFAFLTFSHLSQSASLIRSDDSKTGSYRLEDSAKSCDHRQKERPNLNMKMQPTVERIMRAFFSSHENYFAVQILSKKLCK